VAAADGSVRRCVRGDVDLAEQEKALNELDEADADTNAEISATTPAPLKLFQFKAETEPLRCRRRLLLCCGLSGCGFNTCDGQGSDDGVGEVKMIKPLLTERKPVRTTEQIKASPNFAVLKSANQKEFVLLLAGGASPLDAVFGAYNFKSKVAARVFMYQLLRKETMHDVLQELYGTNSKADFMEKVEQLSRNKDVTIAQVQALFLYGIANGFIDEQYLLFEESGSNHS
jgi:hypothetical protein